MTMWIAACLCLVGVAAFLWELGARKEAENALREKTLDNESLKLSAARALADIEYLRSEASRLSYELEACDVPGVARKRLVRLLGGQTGAETVPATSPAKTP